jgi:myo-inositol-1(or 4)-monophosphatase
MSDQLLRTAMAAAQVAAPELLAAFRGQMQVDYKRDRHDPVTEHDRRAEAAIRDLIFREVPDSAFVGEESGLTGSGEVHWFVDPIDGTANFARGMAFWCTSVGAVIGDRIVAGAIYDPVAGTLFAASADGGAWLNGQPLQSKAVADESQAVMICGYPVPRDFRADGRAAALEHQGQLLETVATLRRPGSAALSIAHVAAGWVDAAAGFGVSAWDVTAAILILRQAGGRYHPFAMGQRAAGDPDHQHPGYLALGKGADYPTLQRICHEISAGRERSRTALHAVEPTAIQS